MGTVLAVPRSVTRSELFGTIIGIPRKGHEPHYPDGDECDYRSCESVLVARTFARLSRANPTSADLR